MTKKVYDKKRLKAKFESYLSYAKKEYKSYKEKKDTTQLAEAGEKLWGAFNYLMELKSGKSLRSIKEVREVVYGSQDGVLIATYENAFTLHQFFYGYTDRIEDIEDRFKTTANGLEIYSKNEGRNFLLSSKKQVRV